MQRPHALIVSVFACAAIGASTDPQIIPQHRLAGSQYVAVRQLASAYELGRDRSRDARRAEYRSGIAELAIEADHRDIHLNGVIHWVAAPVLAQRGALWIRAFFTDMLTCAGPFAHPFGLLTAMNSDLDCRSIIGMVESTQN